jgi:PAS domain S-box-containing protein
MENADPRSVAPLPWRLPRPRILAAVEDRIDGPPDQRDHKGARAVKVPNKTSGLDNHSLLSRYIPPKKTFQKAALVAAAYFLGAEAAFLVGTLSDRIFAPFWPPNVILFSALLVSPRRHWWTYIALALPAHVIAEVHIGMHAPQLLVAFASNCLIAVLAASFVLTALGQPPWLGNLRKASLYIIIAAFVSPAISSLVGAFVPILGGGAADQYPVFWGAWYLANALGFLALGPPILIYFGEGRHSIRLLPFSRRLEAMLLISGLILVCATAFRIGPEMAGYIPSTLYSPLPLILWAAVRFGERGASLAILIVTVVLCWLTLNSSGFFIAGSPETSMRGLQVFLICLSVPVLLLGASIDEAHDAAQATRESEERMAFAAASANIGLWYLAPATDYLWATEHCRSLLGLSPDAPLTRATILEVIHPDDRQSVVEAIRSAALSGAQVATECRVVLPDGNMRWFRVRARSDLDDHGKPFRMSGIFFDITAAKAAEEQAGLQRRELAHLMRVSTMGELSGAIAHELNQPLTAILSNAQAAELLLESGTANLTDIAQILKDIVREDKRAGDVIDRLRGLLRKDKGKLGSLDINELVRSTEQLLHSELISRGVRIVTNLASDLPAVWGDRVQLQQVLLNLVMNAMEAIACAPPALRVVTISTQKLSDGRVETVVSDRGPGLSPDGQKSAFEPFFTTKSDGLGLGLSICSTIVNSHGGMLQLANNPHGGADATFTLPAQQTAAAVS